MTKQQIKWAEQHDWCICGLIDSVLVEDVMVDKNGFVHIEQKEFNNYKELRNWAGY